MIRICLPKALLLFTALLTSACATVPAARDGLPLADMRGAWAGYLDQFTNKYLPNSQDDPIYEVVLLNCSQSPEIWLKADDSGYTQIYGNYDIKSESGNHMLSRIVRGDGWVETQIWALVALTPTTADIQWSRMVSNVQLSAEEDLRSFGKLGYGEMQKISDGCDIFEADG